MLIVNLCAFLSHCRYLIGFYDFIIDLFLVNSEYFMFCVSFMFLEQMRQALGFRVLI